MTRQYDVIILGGGLAGLTLGIQLKQESHDISVLVLERNSYPFPEAAFKVGESTVEVGGQYLVRLLGEEHFEKKHIRKAGPRFFFPAGDNSDITCRVEYGTSSFLPIHTYQVDRGRLENELWEENQQLGIEVLSECRVEHIVLNQDQHQVAFLREGKKMTVSTRWIVDASGRAGLLKKKLGLARPADHEPNAVWFRIDEPLDITDFSDNAAWRTMLPPGHRYKATNHLMGSGYWVWFIPLSSGSTSVGIVAHPAFHPLQRFTTFERTLEWLREYEPQCAKFLEARRDKLQDFNYIKHYAHGCERVFSPERWCLTGEAGVFIDPFLSPGTDFIGLSNSMITTMIRKDLRGEADFVQYVEFSNQLYLNLFQLLLQWFAALYPLMGNHQVMVLWVGWYFLLYMSIPVTLFFHRRLWDMPFMASIQDEIRRFQELSLRGIGLLQAWGQRYQQPWSNQFADIMKLDHIIELQRELVMGKELTDEEVREKVSRNLRLLEATLVEYFDRVTKLLSIHPGRDDINPYAVSLDPSRWEAEGLFTGSKSYKIAEVSKNIAGVWYVS